MAWWRWGHDNPHRDETESEGGLRVQLPRQRRGTGAVGPVTMERIGASLSRQEIRHLTDADGALLALWERHAVLFTLEGPDDEILVVRARAHATTPQEWSERAYAAANEWNHARRFMKAYVGDPTERGGLPFYAEMQVPFLAGAHDELIDELIDCAAAVAATYVDWLHSDAGVL
ncbi:hypothetical protein Lfu02_53710 [Longispora fulva]|uniref:Sensory transduction regulator n=1 Tax=Longispora fulva TaxID=619741 RepID=A0A8J7GP21_9ACTN|nr:YbjN domain-containing protein [Longispora fulva]MBG6140737.1 hypothetical protein [Longispora fulva]GIG60999.1 hypothetical protein Lfu02_53710 [Longispora fulva]